MTATLTFNLPEEDSEYKRAIFANDIHMQIDSARNQIRGWLKHGHNFKTPDEALEACREWLIFENPLELP